MQKSILKGTHFLEDGCFQSVQKETSMEIINFIPTKTFSNEIIRHPRKNEEELVWKIKGIQNPYTLTKRSVQRFCKNISFEDEQQRLTSSQEENSNEDQTQQSALSKHYKDCEQIYKKRYGFGTSWIGHKQYYASNFISPANIQKNNLQYYFQQEEVEIGNKCSFDSHFQSGNLSNVYKIKENQYDLVLQNDFNTKGNTQWFYFRIVNPPKNVQIKINIINFRKSDSLFNYGLLPCIWSMQQQKKSKKGWFRGGRNIKYFKNGFQVQNSKRNYFTLTFTISTPYDNDILKIAHSYPYTHTDLNNYLDSLEKIKYKKELIERQVLVNTLGRNKIQVISIKESNSKAKNRPVIIVIARQHPGETPGSFICEGLIDFFLSKEKESEHLRKNYQIKIIPMMNPDGVVAGNYRSNLYGFDLNRRWDGAKQKIFHQTAYIKKYVAQIARGKDVAFILDLHGHSRKLFSFFYGNPNPSSPIDARLFPLICSKMNPSHVRFEDCTFTSEDYKRNTARVQFGLLFKCNNVLTFQASFFGYYGRDKQKKHFTIQDYKQLGTLLGKSIYIHQKGKQIYDTNPDNKQIVLYKKCLNELRTNMLLLSLGEKQNSGSESSPQECQLKENQGQKLQDNDEYRDGKSPSKNLKIIKKVVRKQMVKLPARSERQMQVLDIAQVNSIFPNNVLALIPNSFLGKRKKVQMCNCSIQTQNSPLVKIYQTCKQQQNRSFYNPQVSVSLPHTQKPQPQKKPSNLLKSNIFIRPRSQSEDREILSSAGLSRMTLRKNKESKPMTDKSTHKKTYSCNYTKGVVSKQTQTTLTFNCMNTARLKTKLEKQISILQLKTIDPSFTSFNFSKQKEVKSIGKTSTLNTLQNIKLRRKQFL